MPTTTLPVTTAPEINRGISGGSLDALRKMIRRDPALKKLGTKIGPTRCYSPAEAEIIRAAYAARQATQKKRTVTA